jgi:UDP-N-acetylmuramoylalanine--D-glutamate ligase
MQSAWEDCVECIPCQTLERAVVAAWEDAGPGDTVLLSPACTSFDQFGSFAERGEMFAREVRRLVVSDAKA